MRSVRQKAQAHTGAFIALGACAAVLLMSNGLYASTEPVVPAPTEATEPLADPMTTKDFVEVWVVLSVPALATLPAASTEQRAALRQQILKQQNDVMAQLVALGATESGRTEQVSNAIAVRLPPAAIPSVKKIQGVTEVRPVTHRNRIGE